MFCKLSPLEFPKLANLNLHVSSCRSVFTFKISLDQGRLPSGLPPLKDNEIYVFEGGGSIVIDGIKVTQKALFEYSLSEKYLLFISKNSSETIAMVSLGKYGVFRVNANDNDTLEPIAADFTPVARDLKDHHANKISRFKIALNRE